MAKKEEPVIEPNTIELENVGPIEHFTIPIPEHGGICVLKAINGSGKSLALEGVRALASGKGTVPVRDGAERATVEGWDAKIAVAKQTRRSGELGVVTLEGRFNVEELVDPGLQSEELSDARRIKALVQIARVEAKPELFYPLVGGEEAFRALVGPSANLPQDLPSMANRVKLDLDRAALAEQKAADQAQAKAEACRVAAGDVDVLRAADRGSLEAGVEGAVRGLAKAEEVLRGGQAKKVRMEAARVRLQSLESKSGLASAEAATGEQILAHSLYQDALRLTAELSEKLRDAKVALMTAENRLESANTRVRECQERVALANEVRSLVDDVPDLDPLAENVETAKVVLDQARDNLQKGILAIAAREQYKAAREWGEKAKAATAAADRLREAAKGTDEILSDAVRRTGTKLRVEAGRLVIATDRSDSTLYCELSKGERWRIALDVAIEAVGAAGVLVIQQEAWEGLDPQNRAAIYQHVRGRHVTIITAEESADEELTAKFFHPLTNGD